jgi:hypothetical protein
MRIQRRKRWDGNKECGKREAGGKHDQCADDNSPYASRCASQRDGDVELPARDVESASGVEAGGGGSEARDGGDRGWGWEGGAVSFSNRRKRALIFFGHAVLKPSFSIRVMTTKNRAE